MHAVEVVVGTGNAPVYFTCEHASQSLPQPWELTGLDRRLVDSHWAYDAGARELTLDLAQAAEAGACLAKFSRLLVDPNRPLESDMLFRPVADGEPILLNQDVAQEDRTQRINRYYTVYHRTVAQELQRHHAPLMISVHSFTPDYQGTIRTLGIGVLFDHQRELGERIAQGLGTLGVEIGLNVPYSGRDGFMHSVALHAQRHRRNPIMLEVRSDLAQDPRTRARIVELLLRAVI